jgi:predicted DNA repair protein MutK
MRTAAAKRYQRRMIIVSMAYVALIGANTALTHLFAPPAAILAAMAVVSALPIAFMLATLGLYLEEESDEFVRDRIIRSMLIAIGILLSATSVIGMLQFEQLVGEVPVFLAFPLWCGIWGIAQSFLSWRDKRVEDAA